MTRSSPRPAALAALVSLAALAAGCGGAAAMAPATPTASSPAVVDDLSTPDEASAAVDRAERTIDQLLAAASRGSLGSPAGAVSTPGSSQQLGQSQGYGPPPPPPPAPPPPMAPAGNAVPVKSKSAAKPADEPSQPDADKRDEAAKPSAEHARATKKDAPSAPAVGVVGGTVTAAVTGNGAADGCPTACAALASMERAAEHLCTLAGAVDARCTGARSRVQAAEARVHAACPACLAPGG